MSLYDRRWGYEGAAISMTRPLTVFDYMQRSGVYFPIDKSDLDKFYEEFAETELREDVGDVLRFIRQAFGAKE